MSASSRAKRYVIATYWKNFEKRGGYRNCDSIGGKKDPKRMLCGLWELFIETIQIGAMDETERLYTQRNGECVKIAGGRILREIM